MDCTSKLATILLTLDRSVDGCCVGLLDGKRDKGSVQDKVVVVVAPIDDDRDD